MLISLEWLNQYINLKDLSAEKIGEILTDLGLEVESISHVPPIDPKVVVGQIVRCFPHPNAESLKLCQVDIGSSDALNIVCGASNAREGIKVAVATVGATLPGNFQIKESKIRGEFSSGMLCSEKELGLSEGDAGIIEINNNESIGQMLEAVLPTQDSVLELSITPNRADCLSYLGLARDIGAKLQRPVETPSLEWKNNQSEASSATTENISVEIEENSGCHRFVAMALGEVAVVPSPLWMQKRLLASGMRPINMVVDITNYVMLEMGQPIHAYDRRDIRSGTIKVRCGRTGDSLTTIDGQSIEIKSEDILICDMDKSIGLAGIMGGQNSEIKIDTQSIIIEVAEFGGGKIRKTSKRLGLHTEASHRFERGVDISQIPNVAKRVAHLLQLSSMELGLASIPKVGTNLVDIYPHPLPTAKLALRLDRTRQILALPLLTREQCQRHLQSLGFELLDSNENRMVVSVPPWRHDIVREIDLIEEIGRLEGFDKIPYQQPMMSIEPLRESPLIDFTERLRMSVAGLACTEVITFPFVTRENFKNLLLPESHPLWPEVKLANPLSEEMAYMQSTLLPGMLRSGIGNRRKGQKGGRLFQLGRGYFDFAAKPIDCDRWPLWQGHGRPCGHYSAHTEQETKRLIERHLLSILLDSPYSVKSWDQQERPPNFFDGKALLWSLFSAFALDDQQISLKPPRSDELPFLHPGASAAIYWKQEFLGYMGELHPKVCIQWEFDWQQPPIVIEIDFEVLFHASQEKKFYRSQVSRFPPVTRDVSLLMKKGQTYFELEACLKSFPKKKYLQRHQLFDLFTSDSLGKDAKSIALSLVFQDDVRTLTDKEVDKELQDLIGWLNQSLDITQR